ncbi:hypothetical protein WOLCODRAFT_140460 [Wolfiporia cocos MD-104 SS10]|uniref:Integral membrane protein S linking to the trans Golgi network-domain-containing protein n=1 Tax=Wolfiporia cocos (strain MD-104) TaxID=742152 RepID=A0A2H3J459_WOLCO|nr:hypothetical protein WOLCODRAFT_140460 [Wolfiporia cocos MD-104 SS10]
MSKSTGWDPVLLISQIIAMQTSHYLTLAMLVSPLLTIIANPDALEYDGGAANVGMVMDWRYMAGRPTSRSSLDPWSSWNAVWSGGKQVGSSDLQSGQWNGRIDPTRGWIIAFSWLIASVADIYYLYTLIRRPRLILDFSLTLIFNHLVLTTYYSAALPSSLFFWLIMAASAGLMIIVGEQLCVKREMLEGLSVASSGEDDVEMGNLLRHD